MILCTARQRKKLVEEGRFPLASLSSTTTTHQGVVPKPVVSSLPYRLTAIG